MPYKIGEHHVNKQYIAVLAVERKTGDDVPSRVPVMAFATLPRPDSGLDFESGQKFAPCILVD